MSEYTKSATVNETAPANYSNKPTKGTNNVDTLKSLLAETAIKMLKDVNTAVETTSYANANDKQIDVVLKAKQVYEAVK